jgi:hypothetical protein
MARPKKDTSATDKGDETSIMLTLDAKTFERLQDYRFAERYEDRSSALRSLVESALTNWENQPKE